MGLLEDSLKRLMAWSLKMGHEAALIGLEQSAQAIVSDMQARLSYPGHGRPSRPGDEPYMQTGELRKSITYKVYRRDVMVTIIIKSFKAYWLEYGTRNMQARPFIRRGLSKFFSMGKFKPYFAFGFKSQIGSLR